MTKEHTQSFQQRSSTAKLKSFVQLVLAPFIVVHDMVIELAARLIRRSSLLRERIPGDDPLSESRKVAVYVHFDPQGTVHEYVLHQLNELVAAGFRVTFVSNAPLLPATSRAATSPLCKEIIWRFNTGYDFGAYKDGIASLGDLNELDALLMMNDSIYGPFWPLSDTLAAIDQSKYDFWGIADSWEQQRYHLQTFFIVFFASALKSSAFKTFWRTLPYVNNKRWVIRNGETRLTQVLGRQHLRSGALASHWTVAETMKDRLAASAPTERPASDRAFLAHLHMLLLTGRAINPMHFYWDVLISDYKCPFIKRELLKANPAGISTASKWAAVIASNSSYDVSLIQRHLKS
ncbi:polysaccharide biosynthesis-like protein [Rhodopseudomonas boonkerdii]|uniref:rhamnan synthesis F family protein n=1 Tax=Rhodopseudomonas boonkerdii TaxID=475937 RepID=UPI001E436349|nr:rhamnan synthesis F family protein [Rhodopseudomonas boonkerdii]UGV25842.1 polysaccharide biosynthesis-like protein [Rhodopseudomonas boonkerdii]